MITAVPWSSPVTALPPAVPTDFIWRLSVEHYHEMIRSGILTDDDPVELLEGWLVTKMAKNPRHTLATQLLRENLEPLLGPGWFLNAQEPITTDTSEPEPDVTVIRGHRRDYGDHHAGPADLGLVVEVADASLQRDRGSKKRIYARAAIPIYWIVNLQKNCLEVYTEPTGPAAEPDYRQRQDFGVNDAVPLVLEGREVGQLAVQKFLP